MQKIAAVFKSKMFYLYLAICFLLAHYVLIGDTFSFTWNGIWTEKQNTKLGTDNYRKSDFDDTNVNVIFANMKFGNSNYNNYNIIASSVENIQKADRLMETDVVDLLENATDKVKVLENEIKQLERMSTTLDDLNNSLLEIVNEKSAESLNCENMKNAADRAFSDGVLSNDKDRIIQGLTDSIGNGPCYMQNRIQSRAFAVIYNKLFFYKQLIDAKYQVLNANKEMILQNYGMFKSNVLEQLVQIRDKVKTYSQKVDVDY